MTLKMKFVGIVVLCCLTSAMTEATEITNTPIDSKSGVSFHGKNPNKRPFPPEGEHNTGDISGGSSIKTNDDSDIAKGGAFPQTSERQTNLYVLLGSFTIATALLVAMFINRKIKDV